MNLNILSDIHLEFGFLSHEAKFADVCILPGDIGVGMEGLRWARFIAQEDCPVLYVAGNHEFYRRHIFYRHYADMEEYAKTIPNLYFMQNRTVVLNGVRFIGATLWTDFKFAGNQHESMIRATMYMNDYKTILESQSEIQSHTLRPYTVLENFNQSFEFLKQELETEFDGPTVVITHHGVSGKSVHPKYANAGGNEYFVSDLEDFILEHQPELWIHGHTHASIDYNIGKTRVIANPRGYLTRNGPENSEFDQNLTIGI